MDALNKVQILRGNWRAGWALDFHTISSTFKNGHFITKRTIIGELLYELKYKFDKNKIETLTEISSEFLKTRYVLKYLKAIIPVPPSQARLFQPVPELAKAIGKKVGLICDVDYLEKLKETEPIKDFDDSKSRKEELENAFAVKDNRYAGKYILLFDDIFRSGETLREITNVLMTQGKISRVYVLTLTKTRVNK